MTDIPAALALSPSLVRQIGLAIVATAREGWVALAYVASSREPGVYDLALEQTDADGSRHTLAPPGSVVADLVEGTLQPGGSVPEWNRGSVIVWRENLDAEPRIEIDFGYGETR